MVGRWLLVLLVCFSMNLQAAIDSRIDRSVIEQGETVRLWLDMAGINRDKINLDALEQDFEVLNRSQKSSMILRNGRVERATELVLTLLPKQTGSITIPAIEIDGEHTRAHPIVVRTVKQVSAAQGGFEVLSTLSSEQPRVQQPLIYRATLLVGQQIFNARLQAPSIKTGKALIEPLGEQNQYQQTLKGREVMVVEQAWMITPEQSGALEITPLQLTGQIQSSRAKRGLLSNSPTMKRIQVTAKPYQLTVAPIPDSYSGQTWLPAERLTLEDHWNSETFKEGEPITRTITLRAEGLSSNQLPELILPEVDGIKQYAAPVVTDQQFNATLASTLTLEVTLIPAKPGELRLPEIRIPWWDVKNDEEQVAVLPAKTVTVLAGAQVTKNVPVENQNQATQQDPAQVSLNPPVSGGAKDNPAPMAQAQLQAQATAESRDSTRSEFPPDVLNGWWMALTGAVAGSVLTLLAIRLRQKHRQQSVITEENAKPDLRQQLQALKQACDNHDAAGARVALLDWAKTVLPGCSNLNQLSLEAGPEMKRAIMELNQQTYSRVTSDWNSELLWAAVKAFDPPNANHKELEKVRLESLYQS